MNNKSEQNSTSSSKMANTKTILYLIMITLMAQLIPNLNVVDANMMENCVPLSALIAQRLNRSTMGRLRMLRNGSNMEQLIRSHHNCLLRSDRIRFKKNGQNLSNDSKHLQMVMKMLSGKLNHHQLQQTQSNNNINNNQPIGSLMLISGYVWQPNNNAKKREELVDTTNSNSYED
ncbi:hypothetical protein BLOT_014898 [Blomia tropicalis]|nr:hypothetical protein BLOT_014898 [Blomia tropicalis]